MQVEVDEECCCEQEWATRAEMAVEVLRRPAADQQAATGGAGGGTVNTGPLFEYAGAFTAIDKTVCLYTLTEVPIAGWTPSYSPVGPNYSLPQTTGTSNTAVTITNTGVIATATPTPSETVFATPTPTVDAATPTPSPTAPSLAATGASTVTPQIVVGVLLCLLGAFLLLGNRRRPHRHSRP
jgi:hypothetical protein